MTPRTIIAIESDTNGTSTIRLHRAPVEYPNSHVGQPIQLTTPAWNGNGSVLDHGRNLRTLLCSHAAVNSALQALYNVGAGMTGPLYFLIKSNDAELLRWEAICHHDDRFLALDPRWPIARMAEPIIDRPIRTASFKPPLRVAAFLSALGRPAVGEWKRLYAAIQAERQPEFPIALEVYVGETELHAAITQDIEGDADTRVAPLPARFSDLQTVIGRFSPHVVHFYCHGVAFGGGAQLHLGTAVDWQTGSHQSSLRLSLEQLMAIQGLQQAWLMILNCCQGANAVAQLHSLAHRAVASGVPAAVGMLEDFDRNDAHEFCGVFHTQVFSLIKQAVAATALNESAVIEWCGALYPARDALSQLHAPPDTHRNWTLPVLYVRPEQFEVMVVAQDANKEHLAELQLQAAKVAQFLQALPPETPASFRQTLLDLLPDVPASMKPDLFGRIGADPLEAPL